jgi:hypothetical protein
MILVSYFNALSVVTLDHEWLIVKDFEGNGRIGVLFLFVW